RVDAGQELRGLLGPACDLEHGRARLEHAGPELALRADGGNLVESRERGVELAEVDARPAHDDRELGAPDVVERGSLVGRRERERALGAPEAPLAVGHDRQVLGRAVETAHRAQLAQRLRVAARAVGGQARGLACDVDAARAAHRGLRVLVGGLRVGVDEAAGHHEVAAGDLGRLLAQRPQPASCRTVELGELDVLGDLGARRVAGLRTAVEPVAVPARAGAGRVPTPVAPAAVVARPTRSTSAVRRVPVEPPAAALARARGPLGVAPLPSVAVALARPPVVPTRGTVVTARGTVVTARGTVVTARGTVAATRTLAAR